MNNVKKYKGLELDLDKKRTFRFDMNAYEVLEEVYGSIGKALEDLETGSIRALKRALYAGLKHEDDSLTLLEVGQIVTDPNKIAALFTVLKDHIYGTLPQDDGKEPEEKK